MTGSEGLRVTSPRMTVSAVQPGEPPFRLVELGGELVGKAYSLADVIDIAHRAGLGKVDFDDPDDVRWVGGDKYTWTPRHW
ncbi:hypothetical protein [Streptomyces sp. NPDC018031]|uniref:hypothetical protein n=1 Tax=Streptomyces sp. NPDC018031 TaxID=3365033 RepID=UPI00379678C7